MFTEEESDEDVLEAMATRENVKKEGVNGLKTSAGLRVTKCLSNEQDDENVNHMDH